MSERNLVQDFGKLGLTLPEPTHPYPEDLRGSSFKRFNNPFREAFVKRLRDTGWRRSANGGWTNGQATTTISGAVVVELNRL